MIVIDDVMPSITITTRICIVPPTALDGSTPQAKS